MDRQEAMDQEFSKVQGGNYFNYVDTAKLERLGITQYKPVVGDNAIRIVYPPDRSGFYGLEIYKHGNVGVNRKTFLCKRRMFNEACPVCDLADSLRKEDPLDERAKALYASRRYLFFVVDVMTEEGMKKGTRWFDCPIKIRNEIKSRSKNKKRGAPIEGENFKKYIDVSHPSNGRDIEFEQTKVKGKYDYEGVCLVESEPIPEDWYENLPEFKDILKESSIEEMREALEGESTSDEEVEDTGEIEREVEQEVEDNSAEETEEPESDPEPKEKGELEKEKSTTRSVSTRKVNVSREEANQEQSLKRDRVRARLENAKRARTSNPDETEE